jgi:hypothetical protein
VFVAICSTIARDMTRPLLAGCTPARGHEARSNLGPFSLICQRYLQRGWGAAAKCAFGGAGFGRMSEAASIVAGDDQETYLVLDDFGIGQAWREMDLNRTNREAIVTDLLDDQYSNPVRVISFNIADG